MKIVQGTHEEILAFVEQEFGAKDKIIFFEKGDVNGANTREVFSFLKQSLPNEDGSTDIRWNFGKFLVDHEGNPFKRYGSSTNPMEMEESIQELLEKKEKSVSSL